MRVRNWQKTYELKIWNHEIRWRTRHESMLNSETEGFDRQLPEIWKKFEESFIFFFGSEFTLRIILDNDLLLHCFWVQEWLFDWVSRQMIWWVHENISLVSPATLRTMSYNQWLFLVMDWLPIGFQIYHWYPSEYLVFYWLHTALTYRVFSAK